MSYCPLFKISFPDFSRLCFHISEWKLVASFYIKSYRSSLTFITVDFLFHELLPFVQNSFSGLFSAMLSHISMTLDRKLPYEELQIKFDFRPGWPTSSRVIALCSKFVFRTFLADTTVQQNNGCRFEFVGVGGGPVLLWQYSQYACSQVTSGLFQDRLLVLATKEQYLLGYVLQIQNNKVQTICSSNIPIPSNLRCTGKWSGMAWPFPSTSGAQVSVQVWLDHSHQPQVHR